MANTLTGIVGRQRRVLLIIMGLLTCVCLYVSQSAHGDNSNKEHEPERDVRDGRRLDQDDPILVEYVRSHLLTPPSTLPYNLRLAVNNTSQYGQNLVALALLQNKRNGFFIECGAWDGEHLSNTLLLEKEYGWTGLLIEADPNRALPLRLKNRKAWTSSACLSTKPYQEVMEFYLDPSSRINSLLNSSNSMKKVFKFAPKPEDGVKVLCIPFYTYLLAMEITKVDYLSLDVEGADFAVLQTIPFDKVIFSVLEVEVMWVAEGMAPVRKFLEDKGYIFVKEMGPDYIFVHSSVVHVRSMADNLKTIPVLFYISFQFCKMLIRECLQF